MKRPNRQTENTTHLLFLHVLPLDPAGCRHKSVNNLRKELKFRYGLPKR
jgi:hypothetical protein